MNSAVSWTIRMRHIYRCTVYITIRTSVSKWFNSLSANGYYRIIVAAMIFEPLADQPPQFHCSIMAWLGETALLRCFTFWPLGARSVYTEPM